MVRWAHTTGERKFPLSLVSYTCDWTSQGTARHMPGVPAENFSTRYTDSPRAKQGDYYRRVACSPLTALLAQRRVRLSTAIPV
jgi:hypothetical protein